MGALTTSPYLLGVCSTVLPSLKVALHISVDRRCCSINQAVIIDIVVPAFQITVLFGLGLSEDDTAIKTRDQVVVLCWRPINRVRFCNNGAGCFSLGTTI